MAGLHVPEFFRGFGFLVTAARLLIQSKDAHPGNGALTKSKVHDSDWLTSIVVAEKEADISDDAIPSAECCAIHLQLLELFVELRERVEEWGRSTGMDADDVWQIFVKLAVARFTRWFQTATRSAIEMEALVPPLDVLMAWHSFMLNPHAYQAFCKTARNDATGVKGISWPELQRSISLDGGVFQLKLSKEDVEATELLGLHEDLLAAVMESPEASKGGTLIELLSSRQDVLGRDSKLRTLLGMYHQLSATGFAYKKYGLYFDLASAVQRQTVFASKMSRLGWYYSPFRDSALQQARERYRRFFSLIPTLPAGEKAVPTLDIDLVWHTHQLSPAEYAKFSKAMTHGRFVNHNDTITEELACSGSKNTATRYREQFGDVYSICLSWYCQAARLAPDKQLSTRDSEQIRDAIACKQRQKKLDLASCQCHEIAVFAGMAGSALPPAPNASCDGNCGDCGGCSGCSD